MSKWRFRDVSVQGKIIGLMSLASGVAMLCVVAAVVLYEATSFRPRKLMEVESQVSILSEVMQAPLEFEDNATADRFLATQRAWPTVVVSAVYDQDGKIFAVYRRDGAEAMVVPDRRKSEGHDFGLEKLEVTLPVMKSGKRIGWIYEVAELPSLWLRLPQYGIMFGAVVIAIGIVGLVLILGVRWQLLRPLEQLVRSASNVAKNNDYSLRTSIDRRDELGVLAASMNAMLRAVEQRNAELAKELSERRRTELELRKKDERFQQMIEYASDAIAIIDMDGVVHYQSASIVRILGFTAAEMLGRNVLSMVHSDDLEMVKTLIVKILARPEETASMELRIAHKDGSWRHLACVGKRMGGDELRVVVNSRDVTESKGMENQLRQVQKMEAVGQLSGGVAHDFNNILTVIKGHVSILQEMRRDDEELMQSLQDISAAADRAANLTRQLLAFGRRQMLQLTTIDLNDVVTGMSKMLQRILGEDIDFVLKPSPRPLLTKADIGMMEQVVLNLVVNARDAMPGGGILKLETSVVVFDEDAQKVEPQAKQGSFVCLEVTDTGTGIPPEVISRIFEPFFSTKEVGKGTGLGLATVYGVVQQHHGWITVRSEVGCGTTFKMYLPDSGDALVAPVAPKELLRGVTGSETILVVEDEEAVRTVVRTVLTRHGFRVLEADSGVRALELWPECRERIQLVLTDIVMPGGVSGVELMKRLQKDKPGLRVICCSGYSHEAAGRDFPLKEGINFISKPFDLATLVHTIRLCLDRRETNSPFSA